MIQSLALRRDRSVAVALHAVMIDTFIASFKTAPTAWILDFDATGEKQRVFEAFRYGAESWKKGKQIIERRIESNRPPGPT